jgi:hypothetical protein
LDLFIWRGEHLPVPGLSIYQITKANPLYTNGVDKMNISRIVSDFIKYTVIWQAQFPEENQVWVRWEVRYSDTPSVVSISDYSLAVKGYNIDRDAHELPANNVLIVGNEFKVGRTSKFVLPIIADFYDGVAFPQETKSVIATAFPSDIYVNAMDIDATGNSNLMVNNFWLDLSLVPSTEEYIEISFNGFAPIVLLLTDECRYTPVDIMFINKYGALQIITFFKERKDSFRVTKEKYNSVNGVVEFNVNSRSKFTVNSGFVSEDKNECFKQLLLSEKCWDVTNNLFRPLNVATKEFSYKTRTNDRLINYEIEFDYASYDIDRG